MNEKREKNIREKQRKEEWEREVFKEKLTWTEKENLKFREIKKVIQTF